MNTKISDPEAIRSAFRFLVDEFNYSVTHDKETNNGFVIEYAGNQRRVRLVHDYREIFFYFEIIRGLSTQYPNDQDNENIRTFWDVFQHFEPQLDLKKLRPDVQTCAEAALLNAQLLRKYASGILRGEEWV
jgi:hypothetical protein